LQLIAIKNNKFLYSSKKNQGSGFLLIFLRNDKIYMIYSVLNLGLIEKYCCWNWLY